jgi:hypothetical protein
MTALRQGLLGTPAGDAAATFTERVSMGMTRPSDEALAGCLLPRRRSERHHAAPARRRGDQGEPTCAVVDTNFRSRREPNVRVALDADDAFVNMLRGDLPAAAAVV